MAKKKKAEACGMCERPIRGASGIFPPHQTARYCHRCFGRIWIILEAQGRDLRESLKIKMIEELPHALGFVTKRVIAVIGGGS